MPHGPDRRAHARPAPPTIVRIRFDGAAAAPAISPADRLPGTANYLTGADQRTWRTNLPTYGSIVYQQLYAGIDLRYGGADGHLKGSYSVAPGSDPAAIRWRYEGARDVRIDAAGNLVLALGTPGTGQRAPEPAAQQTLTEAAPVAWQVINGQTTQVAAGYTIHPDGSIGFALGTYDHGQPLTIDPTLVYSTYLGGSGEDTGRGIAVDSAGNTYVTGYTFSASFPTAGAFQGTNRGTSGHDAFVTKLNASGALVYSTYLDGSGDDVAYGIAVDSAGNAYLAGETSSSNFPTASPLQAANGGGYDAVVAKPNASGSALLYSTYLGGSDTDYGQAVAVDSAGNAYVTGGTLSTNFPTVSPLQATNGGGWDVLVAKLNPTGGGLSYSTYLGGSGDD